MFVDGSYSTCTTSAWPVVPVHTGAQRYDILIGSGLLERDDAWQTLPSAARALVVGGGEDQPETSIDAVVQGAELYDRARLGAHEDLATLDGERADLIAGERRVRVW